MRNFFIVLIIPISLFFFAPGDEHIVYDLDIPFNRSMQVGEELIYEVSYSLLKLGRVTIKVKDKKIINGRTYFSTAAYIDSYSGIPFVDLHQIYESHVSTNYYSEYFRGLVRYEDHTSYTEYRFSQGKGVINIKKGKVYPPEVWIDSITSADKKYQDGLSIFFYARMNFGKDKTENVPCFVNEKKVYTKINFYTEPTEVSIDAVDYDISCLHLDGETDFVSVFGLTGYFEGWFSNDEASIPVIAKMKVIIGNITLELKQWKREGWNPPRYISMKN